MNLPDEMTCYPRVTARLWTEMLQPHATRDSIGNPFVQPLVMAPGNAKARRRWRRRNVPNTQRPSSNMVAQSMAAWNAADDTISERIAKWQADVARPRAGFEQPIDLEIGGPRVGLKGEMLP